MGVQPRGLAACTLRVVPLAGAKVSTLLGSVQTHRRTRPHATVVACWQFNDFRKQATKGKFTPSAQLMADAVKEVETRIASDGDKGLEEWLKAKDKALDRQRRVLIASKAQQVFSTIVGQTWLFPTLEENSMSLTIDGQKLDCKADLREVKIEI